MVYGYARVSTSKQGQWGSSLEDQKRELVQRGAQEIVEEVYTGTTMNRPKFNELYGKLEAGDVLIVTKLDRFARTAAEGLELIQGLRDKGVIVEVGNIGRLDDSANGKLMLTIMLAFAEFERDMIVERTQSGKSIARENGKRVDGRPLKFSEAQLNHAMELLSKGNSYTEVCKMTGISVSTLTRERRKRKAASSI